LRTLQEKQQQKKQTKGKNPTSTATRS